MFSEEFKGWQRRSSGKIYHFLVWFFCASVDVGRLFTLLTKTRFRPWIHQPSESFGLTLATETTFDSNVCSKTARYRLFLAVVRCCVTTTLAAETFGLLNVYLNYKFGLGLPSFYLFFSLFKKGRTVDPILVLRKILCKKSWKTFNFDRFLTFLIRG